MTSLMNAEWESEASDFDDREDIFQVMSGVVADYSAYLSPYLYILDLSITQSRRSRAGKEFEIIIDFILESLKCNFESQSRLGTGRFSENDLRNIAEIKMSDLNANTLDQAVEMIRGTCVSMGIQVKG